MSGILWFWFGLTAIAFCVWLSRHIQIAVATRKMVPLHSGLYKGDDDLPSMTVLVAAKDEADNIETCLKSLLRQDYPGLKLIAINDRSGDETAEIMDRIAGDAESLSTVHVQELPAGWFGKNHAMHQGMQQVDTDWLCFTDADCDFESPRTLEVAVRCAMDRGADFLSILPRHETRTFLEKVIQPACSAIMMLWFNPLKVNDPAKPAAYANGAFMLIRRSCYDAIGGHEAVRGYMNEDMYLARRTKQAGQRLRVVSNLDLYTVRMYSTFAQTWAGWTRIFLGCFESVRRLVVTLVVVTIFSLLPWIAALMCLGLFASRGELVGVTKWLGLGAAATCIVQLSVMVRFYAVNHVSFAYGLFYPLGAAIGFGTILNALLRLISKGTTTWRGTSYPRGRAD